MLKPLFLDRKTSQKVNRNVFRTQDVIQHTTGNNNRANKSPKSRFQIQVEKSLTPLVLDNNQLS